MTVTRKPIDHRPETKNLTVNVCLTEGSRKGHPFTGGKKGSKTLGGIAEDDFDGRTSYLSAEAQLANGDRFHGIVQISPDDSGEHFGTMLMFPDEIDCWVCREAAKRNPASTPERSYAVAQGRGGYGIVTEVMVQSKKHTLGPCPHCGGTGKERVATIIDLDYEFSKFVERTGLTKQDVYPYRYHYFNHTAIQNQIGFEDYHVDEATGWSVPGNDEAWVAYVERQRATNHRVEVEAAPSAPTA